MQRWIKRLNQPEVLIIFMVGAYLVFSWPVFSESHSVITLHVLKHIFVGWAGIIAVLWLLSREKNGASNQNRSSSSQERSDV